MRKFNIFYWLVFPLLLVGGYYVGSTLKTSVTDFYGFAENKETQINLDHDIVVNQILVHPGQLVKKGQVLLKASRIILNEELDRTKIQMEALAQKNKMNKNDLMLNLKKLEGEKTEKLQEIDRDIAEIQHNNDQQVALWKAVNNDASNPAITRNQQQMDQLKQQRAMIAASYDQSIREISQQLKIKTPEEMEIKELGTKMTYIEQEKNRLDIIAPSDGLIGSINCKENEHISNFTSLMSFYESSPNFVTAYIHESLTVKVNVGDVVNLTSVQNPTKTYKGKVVGKGHRIIEIPERLRKVPEFKTYGMEILVNIEGSNSLLHKEIVHLSVNTAL